MIAQNTLILRTGIVSNISKINKKKKRKLEDFTYKPC